MSDIPLRPYSMAKDDGDRVGKNGQGRWWRCWKECVGSRIGDWTWSTAQFGVMLQLADALVTIQQAFVDVRYTIESIFDGQGRWWR